MSQPPAAILDAAAQHYAIPGRIQFVQQSANLIYEFERDGQPYILRLTPGAGRDLNMILGELEFMEYLGRQGARVVDVHRSQNGRLVEVVTDGHADYYAAVFDKAPGTHPKGAALTDAVLINMGQALGMMHRLALDFSPSTLQVRRPEWHELDIFQLTPYIPADQSIVRQKAEEVLAALHDLPSDEAAYGLIHGDPEPANILVHEGELTFIDFDDACYHWFAFDLTVALMMATISAEPDDRDAYAQHAWELLYQRGYRQEHTLSVFWLAQIPVFLRLRLLEDYAFQYLAGDTLADWQHETLRYQRHLIETDTPLIKLSFAP